MRIHDMSRFNVNLGEIWSGILDLCVILPIDTNRFSFLNNIKNNVVNLQKTVNLFILCMSCVNSVFNN